MKVLWIIIFTLPLLLSCSSKEKKKVTEKKDVKTENKTPKTPAPFGTQPPAQAVQYTQWSYSGLTGPDMWGDLRPEYTTCKEGLMQSPINLVWNKPQKNGPIQFSFQDSPYTLMDNGHTIQARFSPGNKATIHGNSYELVELHFHAHSEHSLSGKHFPLEAHFVHRSANGELAIVAIFFIEGKANPYLESMWQQLPRERNRQVAANTSFNPKNLIPSVQTHYHYKGSLTTPPCTEGVSWNVFNTPMELSREQLNHFRVLYANNYRPIQPINARTITNF